MKPARCGRNVSVTQIAVQILHISKAWPGWSSILHSGQMIASCVARIMHIHGIHGIHVQHISTRNRMSVFSMAAYRIAISLHIATYRHITATVATGDVSSSDPEVHRSVV